MQMPKNSNQDNSKSRNNHACRFITIDALPEAETFYSRLGFTRLSDNPNTANGTIPMYFDLGKVNE